MLLTFTKEKKIKIGFHIYPAVFFIFFGLVWREMFFSGEGEFLSQRSVLIHGSVVEKREDKAKNLQDNLPNVDLNYCRMNAPLLLVSE